MKYYEKRITYKPKFVYVDGMKVPGEIEKVETVNYIPDRPRILGRNDSWIEPREKIIDASIYLVFNGYHFQIDVTTYGYEYNYETLEMKLKDVFFEELDFYHHIDRYGIKYHKPDGVFDLVPLFHSQYDAGKEFWMELFKYIEMVTRE